MTSNWAQLQGIYARFAHSGCKLSLGDMNGHSAGTVHFLQSVSGSWAMLSLTALQQADVADQPRPLPPAGRRCRSAQPSLETADPCISLTVQHGHIVGRPRVIRSGQVLRPPPVGALLGPVPDLVGDDDAVCLVGVLGYLGSPCFQEVVGAPPAAWRGMVLAGLGFVSAGRHSAMSQCPGQNVAVSRATRGLKHEHRLLKVHGPVLHPLTGRWDHTH